MPTYSYACTECDDRFDVVQAFTDERLHTGQSAPEIAASLDALMQWIEKGTKPTPQSIAEACEQIRASLDGPCRWHPEFSPKPYNTTYARGAVEAVAR